MRHLEAIVDSGHIALVPVQYGHQKCPPLWSHGPAVRTFWLLHYVLSGKGVFLRDGILHEVNAGDIFVIPPYDETFYQADENEPWHYIWIGFSADPSAESIFSNPVIHRPEAEEIFRQMRRCEAMEGGKSAFLRSKLWELISMLLEEKTPLPSYIEKALAFFHAEYANQISVSDAAKHLNLNRSYFCSVFKKELGIPPMEYLLNLRLQKAAELMQNHKVPPTVAATSSGFSDYCNFSKAFKKKYGVSPRIFRSV